MDFKIILGIILAGILSTSQFCVGAVTVCDV